MAKHNHSQKEATIKPKILQQISRDNIIHIKKDRVFEDLHHSMDTKEILLELKDEAHDVRSILNARKMLTKEPLNVCFVHLEPTDNNKDIHEVNSVTKHYNTNKRTENVQSNNACGTSNNDSRKATALCQKIHSYNPKLRQQEDTVDQEIN